MSFRNYRFDPKDPAGRHSFEAEGIDISVLNAIRRTILSDIPVVGILGEEAEGQELGTEVLENNGPLHNEYLQHRVGLVPLHLSEAETESFEADNWEFSLEVENTGKELLDVTTRDLAATRNDQALSDRERDRILPPDPVTGDYILLTRLRAGERLRLRARPMLGTARLHAGFSPVSLCAFHFLEDPVLAAAVPPNQVLDRERAYARNEYGDPLTVRFQLEIEQKGLTPNYLVYKALDILAQKLDAIPPALSGEPGATITHGPTPAEFGGAGYQFSFEGENDTLGNLLQSHLHLRYVRPGSQVPSGHHLTYAGYICPHPLQHRMLLRLVLRAGGEGAAPGTEEAEKPQKGEEMKTPEEYIALLTDAAQTLRTELLALQDKARALFTGAAA